MRELTEEGKREYEEMVKGALQMELSFERQPVIYGYARISRRTQKIERQMDNIRKEYPDAVIYKETFTGTKLEERSELGKLLGKVQKGDTIVFDSVSRMSRSAAEGEELYFKLYENGIQLVFLKEHYIDTEVYAKAVMQSIPATGNEIADIYVEATNRVIRLLATEQIRKAFEQAQKEVDDLRERTREGIREARKRDRQIGQKKGSILHVKKKEQAQKEIRKYSRDFEGTLSDKDVLKLVPLARNTYYKYKREMLGSI